MANNAALPYRQGTPKSKRVVSSRDEGRRGVWHALADKCMWKKVFGQTEKRNERTNETQRNVTNGT